MQTNSNNTHINGHLSISLSHTEAHAHRHTNIPVMEKDTLTHTRCKNERKEQKTL